MLLSQAGPRHRVTRGNLGVEKKKKKKHARSRTFCQNPGVSGSWDGTG